MKSGKNFLSCIIEKRKCVSNVKGVKRKKKMAPNKIYSRYTKTLNGKNIGEMV